jgi:TPR repeat protein
VALVNLGVCYENATGVERDYEKAFKYYLEAAEENLQGEIS